MKSLLAIASAAIRTAVATDPTYVTFNDIYDSRYKSHTTGTPKWTRAIPETAWVGYNVHDSDGFKTVSVSKKSDDDAPSPLPAAPSNINLGLDEKLLIDNDIYSEIGGDAWWISANSLYAIFRANTKYIFRHSYTADYYVYFLPQAKSILNLTDVQSINFAPSDDQKIAYVKGNNMFYAQLPSGNEIQITDNGLDTVIFNGIADWVYEEEMLGTTRAFYFSKDSRFIAYAEIDDSNIKDIEYQLINKPEDVYPEMKVLGYPKAGAVEDPNPDANAYVYDIETNKKYGPLYMPSDMIQGKIILGRISWLLDNTMVIQWLDRFQTYDVIVAYTLVEDQWFAKVIDEAKEENGWIGQPNEIYPVGGDSKDFVMIQSDGEYQHVFRLSSTEPNKTQITSGPLDIMKIYGVRVNHNYHPHNLAKWPGRNVLFQAAPTSDTRHIYALHIDHGNDTSWNSQAEYPVAYTTPDVGPSDGIAVWNCYTCLDSCFQGGANCNLRSFNYLETDKTTNSTENVREKCEYFDMYNLDVNDPDDHYAGGVNDFALVTCSGPSVPYQFMTTICEHNENFYPWSTYYTVSSNNELEENLTAKKLPSMMRGQFMSTTGYNFEYKIMLPPNYDPSVPHPLIFAVYSGPGSQKIYQSWAFNYDYDYLTSPESTETGTGWIVVNLDSRGMGGAGNKIRHEVYQRLGQLEKVDLTEFARALIGKQVPGVDLNINEDAVAIWGWSYGGFTTSHTIGLQDPMWKCGVSVAPVADFSFYDSIYTERYMKSRKENDDGYFWSFTMETVDPKKFFAKYTLIHGTGDDNVHFQNSAYISKHLLADAGLEFNSYFYADEQHHIDSNEHQQHHVYRLITRKLNDCVNGRL